MKKPTFQQVLNQFKTTAKFDLNTDVGFVRRPKTMVKQYKKLHGFEPIASNYHPVVIEWSQKGIGFGECVFWQDGDKIYCDNEGMSKVFILELFMSILSKAILTLSPKPVRKIKK